MDADGLMVGVLMDKNFEFEIILTVCIQNNPEVKYSPIRFSGGECFQGKHHAEGKEGWK